MSQVAHSLYKETEAAKTLLAQMADIVGEDEEAKRDLVEGETMLRETIALAVKQIGEDEAAIAGIAGYAEQLNGRADRLKARIQNLRTALSVAMDQAGERRIETPFGTVSLRSVPRNAIIVDESEIPSWFWKPQPPKLDKSALTKALKAGEDVPGASLSNGAETIAITR